jgi:hypothetical protein
MLDHLGTFRMVCIEGHRGGADGQGQQAVLVQRRKAHGDGAPDRLANEVDSGQLQLIQELQEVVGKILQGPGIARRRDRRLAHAAHIKPHDAVMLGQNRHPGIPELVILGHAVVQDDRLRLDPRVGEVIDRIKQLSAIV